MSKYQNLENEKSFIFDSSSTIRLNDSVNQVCLCLCFYAVSMAETVSFWQTSIHKVPKLFWHQKMLQQISRN